jgi:diacylglycerol O-acyltransferase / wax synthase
MEQLTGLDASFLYLESFKSPMHIGGIYILSPPDNEKMTFSMFKQYIESRLYSSKVFRRRVVFSPLGLGHPYWIEDPNFNINNHLYHIALPKPCGMEELREAAAQAFSRTLDRNKPLWEMIFVEGLENIKDVPKGAFALITKVHHAAIDGVSGAEMMANLFSLEATPPKTNVPDYWEAERIPTNAELLTNNFFQAFGTPLKFAKFAYEGIGNTIQLAQEVYEKSVTAPPLPFTAPTTPFNVSINAGRKFGGIELDLAEIKNIKNAVPNITINDIVLAVCAGALRKYLKTQERLPQKSLVAMAPISTRQGDDRKNAGNQVSAMLVSLATVESNPLRRLQLISEGSRNSKIYSKAVGANQLMNFIPSTLASLASRLYTSMKLSETHSPFYNLVITNVPGPPMPLYLNGAKVISHFGTAPLFDGLGLLLVVFSYAGKISLSATSTPDIIPDMEGFMQCFEQSFEELKMEIKNQESQKV